MRKRLMAAFAAVLFSAASVYAAPILLVDWDPIEAGVTGVAAGPVTTDFLTFGAADIGDLTSTVYTHPAFPGTFFYEYGVLPTGISFVSEFNTPGVWGGNFVSAGYSFTDAAAAGVAFTGELDPDFSVDFEATTTTWGSGEFIEFFVQSTLHPGTFGIFSMIDSPGGQALGIVPVPVPLAAWGGMALIGAIAGRRAMKICLS